MMDRRTFIQCLAGGALWAGCLPLQSLSRRPLRFGVVTDLHYAEKGTKMKDNYLDLAQNICGNFTDMKLMRDRVVNKSFTDA